MIHSALKPIIVIEIPWEIKKHEKHINYGKFPK